MMSPTCLANCDTMGITLTVLLFTNILSLVDSTETLLSKGFLLEADSLSREVLLLDPDNGRGHMSRARVFVAIGDTAKALDHYDKSLALLVDSNDISMLYIRLSELHPDTESYRNSARSYANSDEAKAAVYHFMTSYFVVRGEVDSAIIYGRKAIKLRTEHPPDVRAKSYYQMAWAYNQSGKQDSALVFAQKVYDIGVRAENFTIKWRGAIALFDVYRAMREFEKASAYLHVGAMVRDSMREVQAVKRIAKLEREYEVKKVEGEAKNKNRVLLLLLLASGIGAMFLIFSIRKNRQIIELQEKDIETKAEAINKANRLLASYSLQISQTGLAASIISKMIKKGSSGNEIIKRVNELKNISADWEQFMKHFEDVHPDFYKQYERLKPTTNEQRHLAYRKIGLTVSEVARLTGASNEAVKKARSRLKAKFGG